MRGGRHPYSQCMTTYSCGGEQPKSWFVSVETLPTSAIITVTVLVISRAHAWILSIHPPHARSKDATRGSWHRYYEQGRKQLLASKSIQRPPTNPGDSSLLWAQAEMAAQNCVAPGGGWLR